MLVEKYAQQLGFEVTVERPTMLSGVAAMEAVLAGELDMALAGDSPSTTAVANRLPVHLGGAIADGLYGYQLVVRPDSDIGSLDDLVERESKIALVIASGQQQFLDGLFVAAYGKTSAEMGIEHVDMSPSEAKLFPKGLDATAQHAVVPFQMRAKGVCKFLVSNEGVPGPAWKGEVDENGKVPIFKNAPFYPEGFSPYRHFNVINKDFAEQQQDLLLAYTLAMAEAAKALDQDTVRGRELALEFGKEIWGVPQEDVMAQFRASLMMGQRKWVWMTEGDARSLPFTSRLLFKAGRIRREVTWDMAKDALRVTAPVEKKAWEMIGRYPSIAEMTRTDVADSRGLPSWMMDQWTMG